ncbi:hypothetical protein BWZ20_01630 [Winogradskyella sp. J14-2]|uniref:hypothetical protein n=1 Tax=Winogradskyella sp. J14-2 TaxID=1936080 RepID=UPI000972AD36|nr:hypothetical protein [Winogradskyella sp. J14-2]APY07080.1 hypothetical protein BWZ20_01630 [Winogradskyella sp. J14-2]
MKRLIYTTVIVVNSICVAQNVDLSQFTLSNPSSPAFVLVEETPTAIYTPDNFKALALHALNNFGESFSIEATPYFLINQESKNRTYQKYVGVMKDDSGELKQNPFSGLKTTTISLAYVDKEFSGLPNERKTYSIGARTTLLRFYNKDKVHKNTVAMATALSNIVTPQNVLIQGEEAIQAYYNEKQDEINALLKPFEKTIKPIFRLDFAAGYSTMFKENSISSGTANRIGAWLTSETSLILNEGSDAKTNNYFNLFLTARYVEDGFNINTNDDYFTTYYRDFGGKLDFEFGKLTFGYEYISRSGTFTSERSVGNIMYSINKDISISGGFGKDFSVTDDNLLTIFGIHWGLNTGNSKVKL